jgi:hypothetical protein
MYLANISLASSSSLNACWRTMRVDNVTIENAVCQVAHAGFVRAPSVHTSQNRVKNKR